MKRISVPIDDEVLAVFERLAGASGLSVGKTVGSWLEDTVEGAEAMADLMEKARQAPKQAVMELHSYALGLTDITQGFVDHVSRASLATSKAVLKAKRAEGAPLAGEAPVRVPSGPRKAALRGDKSEVTPPYSNTGGKVPRKTGSGRRASR